MIAAANAATAETPVHTITFDEALRIALEDNTALRRAGNAAELGEVAVSDARNQFLPDLRLSTSGSESSGRYFSETEGRIIEQSTQSMNLGASSGVTLFNGFRNTATLRGAKLDRAAGRLDLARARETVVFTVAANFLALVQRREELRVQRENLAAEAALEKSIGIHVEGGSRTTADLYAQQAAAASARVVVIDAERATELATVDLMRTLALDPVGRCEFEAPPDEPAAPATADDLDRLLGHALGNRADIQASQARVNAADQALRVARSSHWPTVSLGAGYNTAYTDASPLGFQDQLDLRRGGSVAVSVSIPVFDRRGTHNAVRRAKLHAENARIALEDLRQTVGLQVRSVHLEYRAAVEQLTAAEAQQRATQRSLEAFEARYGMGAATLVELSQARARHVQAASALVRARYALFFLRTQRDYYAGQVEVEGGSQ
jgi:outer membrane protein